MIYTLILILLTLLSILLSASFSGAETGMYQISTLRLRLAVERKSFTAIILKKVLSDRTTLLMTDLLGTNLANYFTTTAVTLLLLTRMPSPQNIEILTTVITAPILFVCCELIPKSIFFYRADSIMPYVAPMLFGSQKIFKYCGLLPVLKIISTFFAKVTRYSPVPQVSLSTVPSSHIKALYHESKEEAFLTKTQSEIINRMESIKYLNLKTVMIPMTKVITAEINSDRDGLLKILKKSPHTRLPVYSGNITNLTGYINIHQALSGTEPVTSLHNFVTPLTTMSAETILSDAINTMRQENHKMILVTRSISASKEKAIGIVTMKDLVEELLGELTEW